MEDCCWHINSVVQGMHKHINSVVQRIHKHINSVVQGMHRQKKSESVKGQENVKESRMDLLIKLVVINNKYLLLFKSRYE